MASTPSLSELPGRTPRAPPGLAATRAGWPGAVGDSRASPSCMVADGRAPGPPQATINMQFQGPAECNNVLPAGGARVPDRQDDALTRPERRLPTPVPFGISQATPDSLQTAACMPADLRGDARALSAPDQIATLWQSGLNQSSYVAWEPGAPAFPQSQDLALQVQQMQLMIQQLMQQNRDLYGRLERSEREKSVESLSERPDEDPSEPSESPEVADVCSSSSSKLHAGLHAASDCVSDVGATTRLSLRFDKADLHRLRTKLAPSTVARWLSEFLETLLDYSPQAASLLQIEPAEARRRMSATASLAEIDRWAARQALNCMDREAPHVRLLLDVEDDGASSAIQTSAVALFSHLKSSIKTVNGEAARLRVAQFDAHVYFRAGDDESLTQLGATTLRDDFRALPAERTSPQHALERALLSKMPSVIKSQCDRLEDLLIEAEALDKPSPWTYSQLVRILAQYILAAARRNTSASEVNYLTKDKEVAKGKCPCCGKAGHPARDCPSSCAKCKLRSCPGTYGAACVFITPESIPTPLLNALGKPVPSKVRDWALREHAKRHSKKQALAAEVQVANSLADELYAGSTPVVNMALAQRDEAGTQWFPSASVTQAENAPYSEATILLMLDGGANINVFSHPLVPVRGERVSASPVEVAGWGQTLTRLDQHYQVSIVMTSTSGADIPTSITAAYSSAGRRNILAESVMWDAQRWIVLKEPYMVMRAPGGDVPIFRVGGVYFVEARITTSSNNNPAAATRLVHAITARRDGGLNAARLWAARMHANAQMLRNIIRVTTGTGLSELTPAMARVADQDTLVKRANMKRRPVAEAAPESSKPARPGDLFILDAFGPVSAPSVLGGHHYELEAVCALTGYGYEISAMDVQQSTWIQFLAEVAAAERSLGHAPLTVRVDRVPNLSATSFKTELHSRLGLNLQIASNHEGVGAAEVRNDIKQRMAEADMMRSECSLAFLLCARKYAGWRLNRRPAHGADSSRLQLHAQRQPNFSDPIPYLFGMECSVLVDEVERGPKGAGCHPMSEHKGRTLLGRFLGIEGHSYLVRTSTGAITRARHITQLNEQVLLLRGVPSGAATVDVGSQTDASATSAEIQSIPDVRERRAQPVSSALQLHDAPPSSRTRSHANAVALVEACVVEAPLSDAAEMFDAALYQFFPEAYDACALPESSKLEEARMALAVFHTTAAFQFEINKATSDVVQVQTDAGIQEYRVPSNHRERELAPDALAWREADELALQVLLRTPSRDGRFNRLVPVTVPERLGQPIVPSVLQRRIKTDPVSRRLVKRKSRLCVAGDRQKALQLVSRTYEPRLCHADAADDLLIKMIMADSAGSSVRPAKRRVKIDIGNAYSRGIRQRPSSYMRLGKSLARTDDAGVELCLELNTPTYGEEPAGDDWGMTFDADIQAVGWQVAEAVPALYYHPLPGGAHALFIRIVDDVLITLPPGADQVAHDTIAAFKRFYDDDVKVEWDPDSFLGFALLFNAESGALTLNMASHIEHAVRQYLPDMLKDPLARPSSTVPRGQTLQSLADALEHTPATGPLTQEQKQVQRIVGVLRYPEKVLPILTLGLHRLSCVAQNPPSQALRVAHLLLELAYDNRFEGLTFGGTTEADLDCAMSFGIDEDLRPADHLEGYADATWTSGLAKSEEPGLPPELSASPQTSNAPVTLADLTRRDASGRELVTRDLYSVLLFFRGAAVFHQVKKLAFQVDCSMGAEAIATAKVAEVVEYASQISRAIGYRRDKPVRIGTDNKSNRQVAMRQGAAARSKHLLRRYHVLVQRVRAGDIEVCYVPDASNPADFLTKWVSKKKLRASLQYVTGAAARPKGHVKTMIQKSRGAA